MSFDEILEILGPSNTYINRFFEKGEELICQCYATSVDNRTYCAWETISLDQRLFYSIVDKNLKPLYQSFH
jgi:hypothetical protein